MGLLKKAGDLVYTFRFLRLLTTDFKDTGAFEKGLIDVKGKRLRKPETSEERDVYTPFHRLVFNIKKLIPGGKVGSYASALYLIKEQYSVSEKTIRQALDEMGVDHLDLLVEDSKWFVLEDGRLSPGSYRVSTDKILNVTGEELVRKKDVVIADDMCYPIGDIFGVPIYEATHRKTNSKVFVSIGELMV